MDDEAVVIEISLLWLQLHRGTTALTDYPADVEVRIAPHPSGTLLLQVRDASTLLPVLMVARSLPQVDEGEDTWTFGPLSLTPGDPYCRTLPDECNQSYAAGKLVVTAGDQSVEAGALRAAHVESDGVAYQVLNGYQFGEHVMGPSECALDDTKRNTFALIRAPLADE